MEKKIMMKENTKSFDLVIPINVEKKIRHLCMNLPTEEWSGILFYSVEGTFEDELKITCLDICVMDIGSSTFTSFKDTPEIINYRIEHPELLKSEVYEGLIHSHDTMAKYNCLFL